MTAVSRLISGVSRGRRGRTGHAGAGAGPPDQRELRDAGDRHRPDLPEPDVAARPPAEDEEGDHHHVHQDRRRRRQREAPERVQHAREQRRQRDEEDVGEGDAPVLHRQREALVAGEAARHGEDQPGHGDLPGDGEEEEHEAEPGERVAGEALGVLAGLDLLGEHRHEGEVEGALGEEAAEHVRQREGDQERLRHRPGAEQRRHDDVPREPEDPRHHRPGADAEEGGQEPDSNRFHPWRVRARAHPAPGLPDRRRFINPGATGRRPGSTLARRTPPDPLRKLDRIRRRRMLGSRALAESPSAQI